MRRFVGLIAAVVVLASCHPEGGQPVEDINCAGGVAVTGLAGRTCAMPTPDAGKSCSDNAECSTICLAETRTCAPTSPYFGCFATMEGGKPGPELCVD